MDKYAPDSIDKSAFHKNLCDRIKKMGSSESITHAIFYGPDGSGKKTLIKFLLELLYGKNVHKTRSYIYKVEGSGNKVTDVVIQQSDYHIVIEPNNNNSDRYLVQDIVKQYAMTTQLVAFGEKAKNIKTVLINNIDNMSYFAQTSLRRTMEKYAGRCRFIMWGHSLSRVIDPLKSRSICIRVPQPSSSEIFMYLYKICTAEKIQLKLEDYNKLILLSKRNVKKAMWMLYSIRDKYSFVTDYEVKIDELVKLILKINISSAKDIRDVTYNILITNFEGGHVIRDILNKLCNNPKIKDLTKCKLISEAAMYDHMWVRGRREMIHIEAFVMGVMAILSESTK